VDLFGVTGSGIMLGDEQNVPRYVAASDGPGRMLEVVERKAEQGPCTEVFVNNTVVASTDVTAEGRWPNLASAIGPHAVRAVLGLTARLGGVDVGLSTSSITAPPVADDERQALARYRDVVESTLATAQRGRARLSDAIRARARPIWRCWDDSSLSRTAPPADPYAEVIRPASSFHTPAATGVPR
jgi:hypothetical protein